LECAALSPIWRSVSVFIAPALIASGDVRTQLVLVQFKSESEHFFETTRALPVYFGAAASACRLFNRAAVATATSQVAPGHSAAQRLTATRHRQSFTGYCAGGPITPSPVHTASKQKQAVSPHVFPPLQT